jgi:hypothetical protein
MRFPPRFIVSLCLALFALLASDSPARAHGLGVQCKLRGGKVEVEAYFDDDTMARDARVQVRNMDGELVAKGRTDDKGRWYFPVPAPGKYNVIVDAGDGHRAREKITIPGTATHSAVTQDPAEASVPLSEGPSREEFTRFPWLRALLGTGIIGGASLGLWLWLHHGRPREIEGDRARGI